MVKGIVGVLEGSDGRQYIRQQLVFYEGRSTGPTNCTFTCTRCDRVATSPATVEHKLDCRAPDRSFEDATKKVLAALQAWWNEPEARVFEDGKLSALKWTERADELERLYLDARLKASAETKEREGTGE